MEAQNTQLVKDAYAAFMRADIPALLANLDEGVHWEAVIGTEGVVPTSGVRQGRDAVAQFFAQVAEHMDFQSFEPREFIAQGDHVAVIGHYTGTAKSTGRGWDAEWVMIFTIRNGKVVRFREYTDSKQLITAFQ